MRKDEQKFYFLDEKGIKAPEVKVDFKDNDIVSVSTSRNLIGRRAMCCLVDIMIKCIVKPKKTKSKFVLLKWSEKKKRRRKENTLDVKPVHSWLIYYPSP